MTTHPHTLYLGLYEAPDGTASCTGTLCKANGSLEQDVVAEVAATVWQALGAGMAACETMAVRNVHIVTNSADLLRNIARTPPPDKVERQWWQRGKGYGNGEWLDIPYGGDPLRWAIIRHLLGCWARGGRWTVQSVDAEQLRKARELWEEAQN